MRLPRLEHAFGQHDRRFVRMLASRDGAGPLQFPAEVPHEILAPVIPVAAPPRRRQGQDAVPVLRGIRPQGRAGARDHVDRPGMAAAQQQPRRVVRAEQRPDDGHHRAGRHGQDPLDPVRRVRLAHERRMIKHAGRERRIPPLQPGRQDDVVGRERGPAVRPREIRDDHVDVRAADRQVHHLAVGLDQGHAVQRLARGLGQAVSEIVGVDPPGRRPGLGEREVAPLRRPAVPVRLVVGPVHEVVDVFPERRHPARLDIEHVVPVVAVPVVRRPGVPVARAPLDQHDLRRLPGELEQADRGRGAAQPGPDDDDTARTTELVRHVTTSLIQRGGARWAPVARDPTGNP